MNEEENLESSPYDDSYRGASSSLPGTVVWETLEYAHHEHSADWYWGLGLSAVLFFGFGIYLHDVLFSAVVIIAALGILVYAFRMPDMITVELGRRGIQMGNELYPYVTLDSFWLMPVEFDRRIIIKSHKKFMSWIVIPVSDEVDPHLVRDYLLQHIREEEHDLPLINTIIDILHL